MKKISFLTAPGIFLVILGLYLYGLMPSIGGGDNGELITAGYTYGIAHAPGYPLYVVCGKLFSILMPFGNPAYIMNLCSAVTAALTVMCCYLVLRYMLDQVMIPALLSLFLSVLPGFWLGAYQAEVFALNGLCAIGILGIMICTAHRAAYRVPDRLVVFLFALSLGNQHTLLLLGPAVMVWEIWRLYCLQKSQGILFCLKEAGILTAFFIMGISIYLFLPIRSLCQPLLDWEDPETWSRFWYVFTRARYGSLQLAQGRPDPLSIKDIVVQIGFFGDLLVQNIGWMGLILLICGMGAAISKYKKIEHLILLTAFGVSGLGIFLLANVKPGGNTTYIMSRFMFLPLIPMILLIGQSVRLLPVRLPKLNILVSLLLCAFIIPGRINASRCKDVVRRDDLYIRDFGKNILKQLPEDTLLFSDRADELEFTMAYFLYALRYRPDVRFIDCNAGVSKSIYGTDYYRIWGKPRLAIRERIEKNIIHTSRVPVMYGTHDPEMINIPRQAEGFLYRAGNDRVLNRGLPWDMLFIRERGYVKGDKRQEHLQINTHSLLAQYFLDMKIFGSADTAIRSLRAYGGDNAWGLVSGFWYYQRRLFTRAEEIYRGLIHRYPDDPEAYVYAGALYNDTSKFTEAETMFKKAINLDRAHVQAHYNLAVTYWYMERWKDSAEEFARVCAIDPGYKEAEKFYHKAQDLALKE
ncbi:MAG: DUF2723 domain-containing protein [bacterium]